MAGKLQNEDFKTEAELTGAGGSASQLLNDTKIWVTATGINKTLDDAITDGDIGSGGSTIEAVVLKDSKAAGANGGTSTSGGWFTRDLNVKEGPAGTWCTLSSNQFTLDAGTYLMFWESPFVGSDQVRTRLRNVTDVVTTAVSDCGFAFSTNVGAYSTSGASSITLGASKTFEIQYNVQTGRAADGLGTAVNMGEADEFTKVLILKLA